jgi:hypothetical protein
MVRSTGLALATLAATLALLAGIARPARAQGLGFPALAPPTDVLAYPRDKAVFLTWTHSPDDAIVGYNVYRRNADQTADKAGLVNTSGPITTTFGTDTGVTNGAAYLYNVKAVYKDAAGKLTESAASQDVPATAANLPGPFALVTLDTNNLGTATVDANNIMTIRASGQDVWDDRTEGTFLVAPVTGDFQITVKVTERPKLEDPDNGDPAAKVGLVILFGGLHHADKGETAYYYNSVERDPEFLMEGRNLDLTNWGVSDNSPASADTTFPAWLRIIKKGQMVTALFSEDANGATFKALGPPHDMGGPVPALAYAGVAVTARKEHQWVIGKIDLNTLKIEAAP